MVDLSAAAEMLRLQVEWGADDAIAEAPVDRYAVSSAPAVARTEAPPAPVAEPAPAPAARPAARLEPSERIVADAREIAAGCETLDALRAAVEAFDGCVLKKTAMNTVFADGDPGADVMFIGEAPGADEDRQGKPFVGVSGQLLDRMIGWIGLARSNNAYITNMLFWRPPGNRNPSPEEIAICRPFVERHIELLAPKLLIFVGGTSAKTMLDRTEGIMRLRGRWYPYRTAAMEAAGAAPVEATAMFHPAYLLRSPAQKRETWRDLLAIKAKLAGAA